MKEEDDILSEWTKIMTNLADNTEDIAHLKHGSSKERTVRVRKNIMIEIKRLTAFRQTIHSLQNDRTKNHLKGSRKDLTDT